MSPVCELSLGDQGPFSTSVKPNTTQPSWDESLEFEAYPSPPAALSTVRERFSGSKRRFFLLTRLTTAPSGFLGTLEFVWDRFCDGRKKMGGRGWGGVSIVPYDAAVILLEKLKL